MKWIVLRLVIVALAITAWHFARPRPEPAAPTALTTLADKAPADKKIAGKPYPFSTSIVSGGKLGGKDAVIKLVQDGYEVKLATQAEADTFKKDPAPYMAKITEAYKTARPCPLTVCPVMGDPLDADAYVFVYEGREFKFCCDSCMDDFEKDPAKYVLMWDDAEKAKAATKKP